MGDCCKFLLGPGLAADVPTQLYPTVTEKKKTHSMCWSDAEEQNISIAAVIPSPPPDGGRHLPEQRGERRRRYDWKMVLFDKEETVRWESAAHLPRLRCAQWKRRNEVPSRALDGWWSQCTYRTYCRSLVKRIDFRKLLFDPCIPRISWFHGQTIKTVGTSGTRHSHKDILFYQVSQNIFIEGEEKLN